MDTINRALSSGSTPGIEIGVRLLLSVLLAAIVGWERETLRKPAGLRTHMLVGLGATVVTLVSLELAQLYALDGDGKAATRIDPARLLEAVMGGVGFLGAGTIIQSRSGVRGITTAAGLWVVAALGIACGAGLYSMSVIAAVFVLVILRLLPHVKPSAEAGGGAQASPSSSGSD